MNNDDFCSYEQALSAGITECLELLENEQKHKSNKSKK